MLTRIGVDLLRILACLLSWIVVGCNHLADALEYRQQVLERIEAEPKAIPIPVGERWGR